MQTRKQFFKTALSTAAMLAIYSQLPPDKHAPLYHDLKFDAHYDLLQDETIFRLTCRVPWHDNDKFFTCFPVGGGNHINDEQISQIAFSAGLESMIEMLELERTGAD